MSGGSFNFLYRQDAVEVLASPCLEKMGEALVEYAGGDLAAYATLELVVLRAMIEERIKPLRDVWQAVERHHSADTGPEPVAVALATYETRHASREALGRAARAVMRKPQP
jgi:hypothetical protein